MGKPDKRVMADEMRRLTGLNIQWERLSRGDLETVLRAVLDPSGTLLNMVAARARERAGDIAESIVRGFLGEEPKPKVVRADEQE